MRKYLAESGETIEQTCMKAVQMARDTKEAVEFMFNGISLACWADSDPTALVRCYDEFYEARRGRVRKERQQENQFYCPHCGAYLEVRSAKS